MAFVNMILRLKKVRANMNRVKNEKLTAKWAKRGDYRILPLSEIIDALLDEIEELKEAIKIKGPDDIKGEIGDVSNMLDMLWDLLSGRTF